MTLGSQKTSAVIWCLKKLCSIHTLKTCTSALLMSLVLQNKCLLLPVHTLILSLYLEILCHIFGLNLSIFQFGALVIFFVGSSIDFIFSSGFGLNDLPRHSGCLNNKSNGTVMEILTASVATSCTCIFKVLAVTLWGN